MQGACWFCNSEAMIEDFMGYKMVECPNCGSYVLSPKLLEEKKCYNKFSSYLIYNQSKLITLFGTSKNDLEILNSLSPNTQYKFVTDDDIEIFYPNSFSERINLFIKWMANNSFYFGDSIVIDDVKLRSLLFIEIHSDDGAYLIDFDSIKKQSDYLLSYLISKKRYIEYGSKKDELVLTTEGYERAEEIEDNFTNKKKVFVAMAFNDNTKNTREAIRKGIQKAEYDATLIDEIIHNKQIVPEMMRLIRESRLLVMDITEPNYGAYYEAGYAQGLGKEVIITCSDKVFSKKYESEEEIKMMKYIRPHFDIAQKQILVWHDEEDLTKKLSEWIKAIE